MRIPTPTVSVADGQVLESLGVALSARAVRIRVVLVAAGAGGRERGKEEAESRAWTAERLQLVQA